LTETEELKRVGAIRVADAVQPQDWAALLENSPADAAGIRLKGTSGLAELVGKDSVAASLVRQILGENAQPVRAILFNKTAINNWPLGWHQDGTIAVSVRHELPGYGPWTMKQGIQHVQPPFPVIESMVTLRLHMDPVDTDNAPLRIAPGSHLKGLIEESDYECIVAECGEMECLAEVGDIWVYRTAILHASSTAKRPKQRRVLQIDFSSSVLPKPVEWAGVI
jgi:ectoine hydroxylase-related dioxygenase (phytanoyl-CoA dioxygenase family)